MNIEGESRTLTPLKLIKYLGVWLDSHLTLTEHVRRATSKAMTAAHSLRLLGNSERGIHQMLWRKLYYVAILPITTYGHPYTGAHEMDKSKTTSKDYKMNAYASSQVHSRPPPQSRWRSKH